MIELPDMSRLKIAPHVERADDKDCAGVANPVAGRETGGVHTNALRSISSEQAEFGFCFNLGARGWNMARFQFKDTRF